MDPLGGGEGGAVGDALVAECRDSTPTGGGGSGGKEGEEGGGRGEEGGRGAPSGSTGGAGGGSCMRPFIGITFSGDSRRIKTRREDRPARQSNTKMCRRRESRTELSPCCSSSRSFTKERIPRPRRTR